MFWRKNAEDGFKAARRGEFDAAFKIFTPLAERGDAVAQFGLGIMYSSGQGVTRDAAKAAIWFERAALQSHPAAQFNLANRLLAGDGLPPNLEQAVVWYSKAAAQGHEQARANLALAQRAIAEGSQAPIATMESVVQAAMAGDAKAQLELGLYYRDGRGVPANGEEAERWLTAASNQGVLAASTHLAVMYYGGQGVPRDLAKALRLFQDSAAQNDPLAQFSLGYMHRKGEGVAQDNAEAVKWYRRAAALGHSAAQGNLAFMYEHGHGVEQDFDEAIAWYKRVALSGDVKARESADTLTQAKIIMPLLAELGPGDFSVHAALVEKGEGAVLTLPSTPNHEIFMRLAMVGWAKQSSSQLDGLPAMGGKLFELTQEGRQALKRVLPLVAAKRRAA
jgi:uncharacterized protein